LKPKHLVLSCAICAISLVCGWLPCCSSLAGESARPPDARLWVPLKVRERIGIARFAEPVTMGVPLPEGLLEDERSLVLQGPDGKAVPAQFTVATRWWPGKSIKWVLLDFQSSIAAKATGLYHLTDKGTNPAPPSPVAVALSQKEYTLKPARKGEAPRKIKVNIATVTTGRLKAVIRQQGFNLFDEAWIDPHAKGNYADAARIVKPHRAGPWLFHGGATLPTYKRFSPMNDPDVKMEVEESGPMRAVLKLSGRHLAAPGDKVPGHNHLLDFVCRMHFYAGKGLVKVVYTMSNRQGKSISQGVPLDRAWLSQPLVLDMKTRTWAVGLPDGKSLHPGVKPDEVMPPWRKGVTVPADTVRKYHQAGLHDCWIFARDSDHIEYHGDFFRKRERFIVKGKSAKTAAMTAGWLDLSDDSKGCAVGLKWFWQTHPRAVKADPSALLVMLHANFESRPPLMSGSHGPRANWYPGMSQTSTSMFFFHGKRDLARITAAYAGLNRPLRAIAPAEWYCEKTQVFGRLASSGKALYSDEDWKRVQTYDQTLRKTLSFMLKFRDYDFGDYDHYGMFNFGDHMNYIKSQRSDPGDKNVTWDNGYYDYPHALLLQFARTGDLDFLETGIEAQHHVMDMDMMCWHPAPKMIGANRYCDGTMHIRWAQGGIYASGSFNHYKTQSHFERFYLTGERRARDMGLLSAEFAMNNAPLGWGEPRGLGHGPLGVLAAWEATGNPRYIKRLRFLQHKIADRALAAKRPARIAKGRHWQGGIALEGIREYYEHTGDPRGLETLKVLTADCKSKRDYAASTLHAFAFLGAQLEDESYTRKARDRVAKAGAGIAKRGWGHAQSFGNRLRNAPYVFWYLSKDLPKKLAPKKLDLDKLEAPKEKAAADG
jgi:PcRGLX-like protein central beta sandwich domain/PcRGLX-like N-terminal RIFT barrel domain